MSDVSITDLIAEARGMTDAIVFEPDGMTSAPYYVSLVSRLADALESVTAPTPPNDEALWDFAGDLLQAWNIEDTNEPSLTEQFRDMFVARFSVTAPTEDVWGYRARNTKTGQMSPRWQPGERAQISEPADGWIEEGRVLGDPTSKWRKIESKEGK